MRSDDEDDDVDAIDAERLMRNNDADNCGDDDDAHVDAKPPAAGRQKHRHRPHRRSDAVRRRAAAAHPNRDSKELDLLVLRPMDGDDDDGDNWATEYDDESNY